MARWGVGVIAIAIAMPRVARADDEPSPEVDRDAEWAAAVREPAPAEPRVAPPSPRLVALRDREAGAERIAIAGYVVTVVGGVVLLAGMPLLISGRIEQNKEENFFQEAGDPDSARRKKRIGATMMLTGAGIACVGATLIAVGLVRKKRINREIDSLATITPWLGTRSAGLGLVGRF